MKRFFQSLFGSSSDTPKILTPAQFTDEFVKISRQSAPALEIEIIKELELRVVNADGKENATFLYNAYDQYKSYPQLKEEVIQNFVQSFIETAKNLPSLESVDPGRIIPVIKDRPWLAETRQALINRGAKKVPENVYEDLNDDLIILYAEDSPKNMRYLRPEDLETAKLDRSELRKLACENLKRMLPKIERHGANGLYMIAAGGDYEASLLLFDGIWKGIKSEVKGDVVVAIPSRDVLIVTGSQDFEGIQRMKHIIKDASTKGSYLLTQKMFVYRDGRFGEFLEDPTAQN